MTSDNRRTVEVHGVDLDIPLTTGGHVGGRAEVVHGLSLIHI